MEEKVVSSDNIITRDDFLAISRRVHYNEYFAEFYGRFAEENEMPYVAPDGEIKYGKDKKFLDRAKAMRECGKLMQFDYYRKMGYKNLIRMNRCRDRFCLNCMALEADQRFAQYGKVLDSFSATYDLYHIVFTVPNVSEWRLADTVTLIIDRFAYLIRYFNGTKRIHNVDFEKYGYAGAVRSLEITVSKKNGSYHPHLHCMFILKKGLQLPGVYWNGFSEDNRGRRETRLFSELEMLLQRIWCLLILRIDVTKHNIEHIAELCDYPDGFSVLANFSNGDYHEVFKYVIKGTFEEETLFKYEAVRTLYKALFGRRSYETFGILRRYDFNEVDADLGLGTPDEAFDLWLAKLKSEELPKRIEEKLDEILSVLKDENGNGVKYVSKATFSRHFHALSEEDKLLFLESLRKAESDETQEKI